MIWQVLIKHGTGQKCKGLAVCWLQYLIQFIVDCVVYADYKKSNKKRLYSGEQIFEDLEPIANMWHNYELIVHEHYQ